MRYLLFLLSIACISCENPVPPESREVKLAKSLCGCTAQLLALNQQAESSADSLVFRKIAVEFEKARKCAASLGIQPADRSGLDLALIRECPRLVASEDFLSELLGK